MLALFETLRSLLLNRITYISILSNLHSKASSSLQAHFENKRRVQQPSECQKYMFYSRLPCIGMENFVNLLTNNKSQIGGYAVWNNAVTQFHANPSVSGYAHCAENCSTIPLSLIFP